VKDLNDKIANITAPSRIRLIGEATSTYKLILDTSPTLVPEIPISRTTQPSRVKVVIKFKFYTPLDIPEIGEKYIKRKGIRHMEKGRIVICVAGT
jgi:hypothetical protein